MFCELILVKSYTKLDSNVINQFLGRKKALMLAVVTNIETNEIFPIPCDFEHIDYVHKIVGISKLELVEDISLAKNIIPSIIEFDYDEEFLIVKSLVSGVSGLEIGFRLRHRKLDLEKGHKLVLDFIKNGEFRLSSNFKDAINPKYILKE